MQLSVEALGSIPSAEKFIYTYIAAMQTSLWLYFSTEHQRWAAETEAVEFVKAEVAATALSGRLLQFCNKQ